MKTLFQKHIIDKTKFQSLSGVEYLLYILGRESDVSIYSGKNFLNIYKGNIFLISGYVNKKAYREHGDNSNWYPTKYQMKLNMLKEYIRYWKL